MRYGSSLIRVWQEGGSDADRTDETRTDDLSRCSGDRALPVYRKIGVLSGEDENKVDEALMAVHAQELGIRNFLEISDGQRQRILLARAICQEPEVMILDEPTSYLDIRHKLELLDNLKKDGKRKRNNSDHVPA